MSFSKTKIFNIALHNLGISSVLQNTDQSDIKAIILNNYYEAARDTVLEAHEWSFATTEKELSVSTSESPNPNFKFAFTYPNDCIASRAIISPFDRKEKKFELMTDSNGQKLILTNHNPCQLRYTRRVENETLFTANFVTCLGFYLAYLAAQSITGSGNKKNTNLQDYSLHIRQAIVLDARKEASHDQDDLDYTDVRY
ncbi:MAG: hypothetical protein LUD50_06120 [Clostridia bacterium]|nr:hypothetical protein [Clostridia bacterium]